jgi:predicted GTPase
MASGGEPINANVGGSADARGRSLRTVVENRQVQEILRKLRELAETKPMLVVLLIGKTGMGKSSLFYSIFGRREIPAITTGIAGDTFDLREVGFDGVTVRFIDTPGLDKVSGKEGMEYCKMVKPHIKDADLILFCYQVTQRVRHEDLNVMKFLKRNFGDGLLAKTVVILTFTNSIVVPDEYSLEEEKEKVITTTINDIKKKMEEAEFDHKIVDRVEFVCADNPYRPDGWLPDFLVKCLTMGISENTKAALLQTTYKVWAEEVKYDKTTQTLNLSAGVCLILIGIPALIVAPIGATVITAGGITVAIQSKPRREEYSRNAEYQKRINKLRSAREHAE